MQNIANTKNCFGCGVCAIACPKKIISIVLNKNGFYQPEIVSTTNCNSCGLCLSVCAFANKEQRTSDFRPISSYAGWSNDEIVRYRCSSGGIGFEIGRQLLEHDYKACVVKYNSNHQRAEHYIATTESELSQSIGSKYIQSYTIDGFGQINKRDNYIVVGTPCQIDSIRRYVDKFKVEKNFLLIDFFCHSVPSLFAWKKYLDLIEKRVGAVTNASWRDKKTGWHDSWSIGVDNKTINKNEDNSLHLSKRETTYSHTSRLSEGNVFYKLFLGDFCCNPACLKDCRYKYDTSFADIRIGDLWGSTYKENQQGVSAVISFTTKGDSAIKSLKNCTLIEHSFEVVAEGQMRTNVGKAKLSLIAKVLLKTKHTPLVIWKSLFIAERLLKLPQKLIK